MGLVPCSCSTPGGRGQRGSCPIGVACSAPAAQQELRRTLRDDHFLGKALVSLAERGVPPLCRREARRSCCFTKPAVAVPIQVWFYTMSADGWRASTTAQILWLPPREAGALREEPLQERGGRARPRTTCHALAAEGNAQASRAANGARTSSGFLRWPKGGKSWPGL